MVSSGKVTLPAIGIIVFRQWTVMGVNVTLETVGDGHDESRGSGRWNCLCEGVFKDDGGVAVRSWRRGGCNLQFSDGLSLLAATRAACPPTSTTANKEV